MPYRLGIDLGTTFTAAAVYRDHTVQSELVPLGTHSASVPTVLFVDGSTTLVGEPADRRALTHPECVVRDFKRRLGDPTPLVVGGQPHTAPELAARLVDWVVDQVTTRAGAPPEQVAVTYPAAWGPHRESLLRNALPGVSLLTEPQAAALAYASTERVEVGATIAVYDLGGGTFDAVVVRKTTAGFTVLGTPAGLDRLGGLDIDDMLLDHVLADTPPPTDPVAMARLRRECVEAKEALSVDTETVIPAGSGQVRVSRAEFETMVRPMIAETVRCLDRAIRSAGLTAADLTTVLLVGGSSRIPLVRTMIEADLGCPVAVDADPKGVVAVGAALSLAPTRGPLKPVHNSTPPALPRPRPRLRRTKIVVGAFVMLLLALAVLPSPFSTRSNPAPEDRPAGAVAPAGATPGGTSAPGSTRKPAAPTVAHANNPASPAQPPPPDPANPGSPQQQQAAPPAVQAPATEAPPPSQAPEPPPTVAAAEEPSTQEPPPPPPPTTTAPTTTAPPQPTTTVEPPPSTAAEPPTDTAVEPPPSDPPSS